MLAAKKGGRNGREANILLRFILIILRPNFLDTNFRSILCDMNILLLHLFDTAVGELVAEDVHLW